MNYVSPKLSIKSFNCPHCNTYSLQHWTYSVSVLSTISSRKNEDDIQIATCERCGEYSIWYKRKMIYPDITNIVLPNTDMPEHIKKDYNEARSIFNKSPKASCALLRLAIQKLCKDLGEKGKNINIDIGNLVKKGLPRRVQQALDTVRVIGNNAVHPGVIDIDDNIQIAEKLFKLVNFIVEKMIVEPKEIDALFNELPEGVKEGIIKRDE